jgi:hypothetical protein
MEGFLSSGTISNLCNIVPFFSFPQISSKPSHYAGSATVFSVLLYAASPCSKPSLPGPTASQVVPAGKKQSADNLSLHN